MIASEFSRPIRLDTIGQPRTLRIEADAAERAALARRFDLVELARLEAEVTISRGADEPVMGGRIEAEAVQRCIATGAPVPARIAEDFSVRFRPEPAGDQRGDEQELDEGELDTIFYEGGAIDAGEAVAQTFALALDPYPRADDAAAALREAGVKDEGEAGPFGALAELRDKLGNRSERPSRG